MTAFIASLLFVTLAEMGDKTQLLAMAFATRYSARIVLAAVFVATLLNHTLAVAAGQLLTTVIPVDVIAFVAALSFILFGLWTIRGDSLEGEDERPSASDPDAPGAIKFVTAGSGFQATNPQAAVYWNPANAAKATYTIKGTFKLLKPSGHTNYYGLVFGGSDLEGPTQKYIYFMVAQHGTWLIKVRDGDASARTGLTAVTDGVYGIRINHQLEVQIDRFGLSK